MGKVQEGCFWMYSDPLITILMSICPKNLVWALANLLVYAVIHCTLSYTLCGICNTIYGLGLVTSDYEHVSKQAASPTACICVCIVALWLSLGMTCLKTPQECMSTSIW